MHVRGQARQVSQAMNKQRKQASTCCITAFLECPLELRFMSETSSTTVADAAIRRLVRRRRRRGSRDAPPRALKKLCCRKYPSNIFGLPTNMLSSWLALWCIQIPEPEDCWVYSLDKGIRLTIGKGQLISKCLFGVFKLTKITIKLL